MLQAVASVSAGVDEPFQAVFLWQRSAGSVASQQSFLIVCAKTVGVSGVCCCQHVAKEKQGSHSTVDVIKIKVAEIMPWAWAMDYGSG